MPLWERGSCRLGPAESSTRLQNGVLSDRPRSHAHLRSLGRVHRLANQVVRRAVSRVIGRSSFLPHSLQGVFHVHSCCVRSSSNRLDNIIFW